MQVHVSVQKCEIREIEWTVYVHGINDTARQDDNNNNQIRDILQPQQLHRIEVI